MDATLLGHPAVRVAIGLAVLAVLYFLGRELRRIPAKLHVLMATAFLDMVGVLMVLPLLPFYAKRLGGGGAMVGLLISSFAVAQLLSAPLWGRFSDRFGRRPTLLVALSASVVAYVVFAFATSIPLLFLSRIVQGAGGGTVGVIQAYVADATEAKDRAKSLGWLSAATNLGVALGPVLGSLAIAFGERPIALGDRSVSLGYAAPGLLAAVLCLVAVAFAWRYLPESRTKPAEGAAKSRSSSAAVLHVLTHGAEPSSRLIWIYAIAMGAFQGATAILALYLAAEFAVTEKTIGFVFMYVGVLSVLTRALVLGKLVDRLGEAKLARIGTVFLATGLAGIALSRNLPMLALFTAGLPLGTAFTFPCVTAMLTRVIAPHERGLYMGVQQTFGGVARVATPIGAGLLFDNLGHGWPFFVAAALVLGTLGLGARMEQYAAAKH